MEEAFPAEAPAPPRRVQPERTEAAAFPDIPEPRSRPLIHDFAEFEEEASAFLGPKRNAPAFDEDFPGFGGPVRQSLEPTSEEVMSKMSFEPKPAPVADEEEPPPAAPEVAEAAEPEKVKDDKRPRRRRARGRGKGRDEDTPAEGGKEPEAAAEPTAPPEFEPISFDDVPFVAASERPREQAPLAEPVKFRRHEPEEAAKPTPAPAEQEAAEPAPPPQKEAPRGFGFGIFDE
jgi:hypothetical protein